MDVKELIFLCESKQITISFKCASAITRPAMVLVISKGRLYRSVILTEYELCFMGETLEKEIDKLIEEYNAILVKEN